MDCFSLNVRVLIVRGKCQLKYIHHSLFPWWAWLAGNFKSKTLLCQGGGFRNHRPRSHHRHQPSSYEEDVGTSDCQCVVLFFMAYCSWISWSMRLLGRQEKTYWGFCSRPRNLKLGETTRPGCIQASKSSSIFSVHTALHRRQFFSNSFIPVWSTSCGMGGVPPSHITLCNLIFVESWWHDPDLRIFPRDCRRLVPLQEGPCAI